ncbi:MAG: hypothetical protein EOO90_00175 [Pedobacter sp.]|nr:MAG: hypothetical protein EOO90_00175 [Pedobacter sp.]
MFKSIKTGVLALILIGAAFVAQAQKTIKEGTITYTYDYQPTEEQSSFAQILPKETKIRFSGNLLSFSFESGLAKISLTSDFVNHNSLTLVDVPVIQAQYAVKGDKATYDKDIANLPKFSDFKATGEKKTIANFNCEKYTYKDNLGNSYELWATKDIELPSGFYGEAFKEIKGALIQYTSFQQGVKVNIKHKAMVEEKVGKLSLDVPSGYEIKTMEEVMSIGQ